MNDFQSALTSQGTYATVLITIFIEKYGTEGFTWSPETMVMEINEDFNIEIPPANLDRLLTAINLLTSDDFYKSLPDFNNFCNILSGDTYDPRSLDMADATECAWGITEGLLISPPEGDKPFSDEIVAYIGAVLDQEGIINPPDVLKIAVRDRDQANFVAGEFSDDPEMFDAIYDLEASKTEDVNNMIRTHLQQLTRQLEALPLRVGDTKGVVQQMLKSFGKPAPENDSLI